MIFRDGNVAYAHEFVVAGHGSGSGPFPTDRLPRHLDLFTCFQVNRRSAENVGLLSGLQIGNLVTDLRDPNSYGLLVAGLIWLFEFGKRGEQASAAS